MSSLLAKACRGGREKYALRERPLLAGNCLLLCFVKLRVAFVHISTFVFRLANVYLLATINLLYLVQCLLPFCHFLEGGGGGLEFDSWRSFQFVSGICIRDRGGGGTFLKILKSYWEKLLLAPPLWVTCQPHYFQSRCAVPVYYRFVAVLISPPLFVPRSGQSAPFSLAMFCTKLEKGLTSLRLAFWHVPRLTECLI